MKPFSLKLPSLGALSLARALLPVCALLLAATDAPAQGAKRLHGICFGPFRTGESPEGRTPLPSTLREDVQIAAKVAERLRTYGMGGGGWLVPQYCEELGLECWPGAWLGRDRAANDRECELLINAAKLHSKAIGAVYVGNEVLLRGDLTPAQLRARLEQVRDAVDVPVTTAEPWKLWLEHPTLIDAVDIVTVHIYPYWDEVPIEGALAHTLSKLDQIRRLAGKKPVVLGEFGWPASGAAKGQAVPSADALRRYLSEIIPALEKRRRPYFLFEMWDEAWKVGHEGSVGPHWGIYRADGSPKFDDLPFAWAKAGASQRPPRVTTPLVPKKR